MPSCGFLNSSFYMLISSCYSKNAKTKKLIAMNSHTSLNPKKARSEDTKAKAAFLPDFDYAVHKCLIGKFNCCFGLEPKEHKS